MAKFLNKNKFYFIGIILVLLIVVLLLITKNSYFKNQENNQNITSQPSISQTIENLDSLNSPEIINNSPGLLVTRVIDGDTIELENGKRVRYLGINTPESVDPRKPVECFGKEASFKNKELVLNKKVVLEKDISEIDKYGRLLRYVYVDNIFVNLELIKQGYA